MKKIIKEYLPYVLVIIIVLLIKKFIVTPIRVNGDSMLDTLHNGDIMILNNSAYYFKDIERFDIVVVDVKNEYLIKRVIGLPGEKIEYKNNKLYINGKRKKENYLNEKTEDFKIIVPKNSYFVMGDNRINSMDSRSIGPIKKNKILGKTKLIIFPFNRFGIKN